MRLLAMTLACALVTAQAAAAGKATLGGRIVATSGKPVAGAKVSVLRPGSDKILFSTTSADTGLYAIDGLEAGKYHIRVEPGQSLRGDAVAADVTDKGLIVNWRLSPTDAPIALAIPGQVGGAEEGELCSPVQIGEYEINRCVLAGGVVLAAGLGIGLGVGLSDDGGGDGSPSK